MYEKENYNYETDSDALTDFMKRLPNPTVKLLNFPKYWKMIKVAYNLQKLMEESNSDGSITVEILQEFNLGAVSVELPILTVLQPQGFAAVVSKADNFEIYPLTNGNLRMDITFQSVLKGYYEEAIS